MKLLIGVPAYNEEKTIVKVIKGIPNKLSSISAIDLLIVNDGSTDGTVNLIKKKHITIVSHLLNRGLGAALKTIFSYAKGHQYDLLITMDADGQHNGRDINRLITHLMKTKSDIVIGSRWLFDKKPLVRYLVNKLANIFTFALFGVWSSDTQSGFRVFNRKSIDLINLQTDGMEVSSEFFREIYRNKLIYSEVPINAVYTDYSKSKGQQISNAPTVFIQLLLRFLR